MYAQYCIFLVAARAIDKALDPSERKKEPPESLPSLSASLPRLS